MARAYWTQNAALAPGPPPPPQRVRSSSVKSQRSPHGHRNLSFPAHQLLDSQVKWERFPHVGPAPAPVFCAAPARRQYVSPVGSASAGGGSRVTQVDEVLLGAPSAPSARRLAASW